MFHGLRVLGFQDLRVLRFRIWITFGAWHIYIYVDTGNL